MMVRLDPIRVPAMVLWLMQVDQELEVGDRNLGSALPQRRDRCLIREALPHGIGHGPTS